MFANSMSARLGGMNDGKGIVNGFDKRQTLADFMAKTGVTQEEIHEICWLREGSIGVHFKEFLRAQEYAARLNGRRQS
jgi:hypothetical protein